MSKRRASPEDHEAAKNRYEKAKAVHSIVCFSYKQLKNGEEGTQEELESLMRRAVWHFDRKYASGGGDFFELALSYLLDLDTFWVFFFLKEAQEKRKNVTPLSENSE